jgi:hypothetical protein
VAAYDHVAHLQDVDGELQHRQQVHVVAVAMLAMLRWTNTAPGSRPSTSLAVTRLSEHPIHRYWGRLLLRHAHEERRIVPCLLLCPGNVAIE